MVDEFEHRLNQLTKYWISHEIAVNPGLSSENLNQLEVDLDFLFEEEFIAYMAKIDGFVDFESDKDFFSFWSHTRILEENTDGSHPVNVIWFADYCINLCSYGIHRADGQIYTHFQGSHDLIWIANSYSEFVDLYLKSSDLLIK